MMQKLMVRAEAIARAAQRRRLEEIAGGLRRQSVQAEVDGDSIVVRAGRLIQRGLGDPQLRFAGRGGD